MRSLEGPREPFTMELVEGITLTVRPRDWFSLSVAQAAATRQMEQLKNSASICIDAGLLPDSVMVDLTDADHTSALYHTLVVQEVAVGAITDWTGVLLDGAPMVVTPENVRRAMSVWPPGMHQPLGELFFQKYMAKHAEIAAAKKDSATCAGGISTPTPVASTATDARKTTSPAPVAKQA